VKFAEVQSACSIRILLPFPRYTRVWGRNEHFHCHLMLMLKLPSRISNRNDLQCDTELRNAFLTFINSFNLLICVRCLVAMRGEGQAFLEAHVYVNSSFHKLKVARNKRGLDSMVKIGELLRVISYVRPDNGNVLASFPLTVFCPSQQYCKISDSY
jgi:hypothetical protein